jgi:NAD(P)-dependent dehydrogenase (short-subunit alcohol dehydrogenase family)
MSCVFFTGANRGIGLELVRQYAADGWRVIATCRDPNGAADLARIAAESDGRVERHPLDVTDASSVAAVAEALASASIDVLINNAGMGFPTKPPHDRFGNTDYARWKETLDVNVLGVMRVAEALAEQVTRSELKMMVTISSGMGSITNASADGETVYRTSKAAVNMLTKMIAGYVADRGITVTAIGPGWVRTDMGGPNATFGVEEAVSRVRKVIKGLTPADSGSYFDNQGQSVPW